MNKELLVNEKLDFKAVGEQISHELAAKMVKDHHDGHTLDGSNSYVIGKSIIEKVLAQPGCVAIRFFDALNEAGNKTLVYIGLDSKGKSIVQYTSVNEHGKIAVTEGMANDKAFAPKPLDWFSI